MLACHECERHTSTAVGDNLLSIDIQPCSSDLSSFEPRSAHATFRPLDNETPFKFGNRTDNDNHGPTQWPAGVDVFPEAD